MFNRTLAALGMACAVSLQAAAPAQADNQMGYRLLTPDQASALARSSGKLGLNVGRAQQITSGGMTFELLRVNGVTAGSPAAQAGIRTGDQVIAVDGRVFPSVAAFAAYVGSMPPGREISIDYMPANGGPQDAQRVGVRMGGGTRNLASQSAPGQGGLTFGQKAAIGVGAAALFGCYELGCFSRKPATNAPQ